jgi:hypothetical protein
MRAGIRDRPSTAARNSKFKIQNSKSLLAQCPRKSAIAPVIVLAGGQESRKPYVAKDTGCRNWQGDKPGNC